MRATTPRVLYVDDNEGQRYAIARELRRAGFEVVEVANGEDALREVLRKPDLVILDVNLPDMDGFEICRRIKANPGTATIPVMHLSATFISAGDRVHGLDCGADAYLVHPVDVPELIAQANALVRGRELWQQQARKIRPAVILSVDSNSGSLRSRRMVLESEGYVVLNATKSDEAVALIRTQTVDAVVLDLDVPGLNATATVADIKRFRRDLPVLLYGSSYTLVDGADATLVKADGPEALLRKIQHLLKPREQHA